MSPKPRPTFAKRQKEQARQEKQRAKMQRKLDKKLGNQAPTEGSESEQPSDDQLFTGQENPGSEGLPTV
ncbi:MAG: hypothetical protein ACJ72H_28915 [Candidatus Sulfotelmatobacter sp.]